MGWRDWFKWTQPEERSVLLLGYPGKTTYLYWMRLHELVNSVPTIGFNVETFKMGKHTVTAWDIGGCDKIRPLVRHYINESTSAVIFFFSCKRTSVSSVSEYAELEFSLTALQEFVTMEFPSHCIWSFFFNCMDLPEASRFSEQELRSWFTENCAPIMPKHIQYGLFFGSVFQNSGIDEMNSWLSDQFDVMDKKKTLPSATGRSDQPSKAGSGSSSGSSTSTVSIPASPTDDLSDEQFLHFLAAGDLPSWDHKTHLRVAFLFLQRQVRREAVSSIMTLIKNYIEKSAGKVPEGQKRKTFHITMTYFWIQMVHFAMADLSNAQHCSLDKLDFDNLLQNHPELLDGSLFRKYYSDDRMLKDLQAREQFVPPDLQPLPTMLAQANK
jgi:hypothetical protein